MWRPVLLKTITPHRSYRAKKMSMVYDVQYGFCNVLQNTPCFTPWLCQGQSPIVQINGHNHTIRGSWAQGYNSFLQKALKTFSKTIIMLLNFQLFTIGEIWIRCKGFSKRISTSLPIVSSETIMRSPTPLSMVSGNWI